MVFNINKLKGKNGGLLEKWMVEIGEKGKELGGEDYFDGGFTWIDEVAKESNFGWANCLKLFLVFFFYESN